MRLTENERRMLAAIAESEYHHQLEDPTWGATVCEDRSDAGAVGHLVKKGLVECQGRGTRESTLSLTPEGCRRYCDDNPQCEMAADYLRRLEAAFGAAGHDGLSRQGV